MSEMLHLIHRSSTRSKVYLYLITHRRCTSKDLVAEGMRADSFYKAIRWLSKHKIVEVSGTQPNKSGEGAPLKVWRLIPYEKK